MYVTMGKIQENWNIFPLDLIIIFNYLDEVAPLIARPDILMSFDI